MTPAPVLCIGAAHWDLVGRAAAPLPPGADVPGRIEERPGGVALNVALALAALGRPVALAAAVGRDPAGERLVAHLTAAGVDCAGLWRHGVTGRYLAIEDPRGELHAAVADCAGLEAAGPGLLAPLRDRRLAPARILVDGNLPAPVLTALIAEAAGTPLVAVPASPDKAHRLAPLLAAGASFYLNRREAEALCGARFPDSRTAALAVRARGAAAAIVTDGPGPVTLAAADRTLTLLPPPVALRSLTGAGDALVAAHLAARADGLDAEAALSAALAASARHIARAS